MIIAEGKKPGAIKDAKTLNQLDLFQRYMEQGEGAGGSLTATTMLKKIFRIFHEGDPKWEMLPTRNDYVGQLFFLLTSGTRPRRDGSLLQPRLHQRDDHHLLQELQSTRPSRTPSSAPRRTSPAHTSPDDSVRYLLAGGLFGILAAQNEEVDWSYRSTCR